ncbi:hypothetical protein GCM10011579_055370 [Streptomyces albiflavescens]|uniref:Uncharacterized protein n=1 Tax=Streptomyces albiflavescens TaxID=1623582 RepID=A0A917Y952_9ACTN|nr:hypothetical protein GCM10011579_055370 [Streptomyces albiflavescens]
MRLAQVEQDAHPRDEAADKVGHVISSDQLVATPRDGSIRRRGLSRINPTAVYCRMSGKL